MINLGEYIEEITSFLNNRAEFQYYTKPLFFFGSKNKNIEKIKIIKILDENKTVKLEIVVNGIKFHSSSISYSDLISMIIKNYVKKNKEEYFDEF